MKNPTSGQFPRIAVVGSRDFKSQYAVERLVYLMPQTWTVVTGGARGVDKWAEQTARHYLRDVVVYEPDWKKYGKSAGFIRNNEIVRDCDVVVAFWDGKSKGTKHSIQLARYLKKPCIILRG